VLDGTMTSYFIGVILVSSMWGCLQTQKMRDRTRGIHTVTSEIRHAAETRLPSVVPILFHTPTSNNLDLSANSFPKENRIDSHPQSSAQVKAFFL